MTMSRLDKAICALGLVTFIVGGCASSEPTRFYVLTPAYQMEEMPSEPSGGKPLAVGVGPIRLPDYLDRPQITDGSSGNRLTLAEFDRWAEPLESGFSRVLAENLSVLLGTDRVLLFPWKHRDRIDCHITVDVVRFDGGPGEQVSLITRWTVFGPDGNELVPLRGSRVVVQRQGSGYEVLTRAMSDAIGKLSDEIASAIKTGG